MGKILPEENRQKRNTATSMDMLCEITVAVMSNLVLKIERGLPLVFDRFE